MFRVLPAFLCALGLMVSPLYAAEGGAGEYTISDHTYAIAESTVPAEASPAADQEFWISNYSLDVREGAETQVLALDAGYDFTEFMREGVPAETRTQGLRLLWTLMAANAGDAHLRIAEDFAGEQDATGAVAPSAATDEALLPTLSEVPAEAPETLSLLWLDALPL